jgi:hypothetical protein
MGLDRFIHWGPAPEWGPPTLERMAAIARDFLGERWLVTVSAPMIVCECEDPQTYALASERNDALGGTTFGEAQRREMASFSRAFEIYHDTDPGGHTSVITRATDDFTSALADRYAAIVARWWNGEVQKGNDDEPRRSWRDIGVLNFTAVLCGCAIMLATTYHLITWLFGPHH